MHYSQFQLENWKEETMINKDFTVVYGLELPRSEMGHLLGLPQRGNEDSCSAKCRSSLN